MECHKKLPFPTVFHEFSFCSRDLIKQFIFEIYCNTEIQGSQIVLLIAQFSFYCKNVPNGDNGKRLQTKKDTRF